MSVLTAYKNKKVNYRSDRDDKATNSLLSKPRGYIILNFFPKPKTQSTCSEHQRVFIFLLNFYQKSSKNNIVI